MLCPNCKTTLLISDKQGVEVDYCPNCRGIWLDRGELEKIMERSAQHYSRKENYESDYKKYGYQDYDKDRHNPHHPHKKKKSFLDDFFDF
ncbi:MAG: zf-TFIIB domain-containing protein [Adhaeribacter sp.]